MADLAEGRILLSRFSLIQLVGSGGMGQVWRVADLDLQEEVAVKILAPELSHRPDLIQLLKAECRNARRLNHPHIVRIYDFHSSGDLAFISMEYVEGEDLGALCRRSGRLDFTEAIRRVQPVTSALAYAHRMGIVHRDVKASNILTDRQDISRLTDFGISAAFHHEGGLHTSSGGSPHAMSPQQLDGKAPHPSDDIYALGSLLYGLLTGHPPFYPHVTPERIRNETPPPVNRQLESREAHERIPEELDRTIARMLSKDPEDRPGSMETLYDAFQDILDSQMDRTIPPVAKAPSPESPIHPAAAIRPVRALEPAVSHPRRPPRKRPTATIYALVLLAAALVFGGALLIHHLAKRPVMLESVSSQRAETGSPHAAATPETGSMAAAPGPVETGDPSEAARLRQEAEKHLERFVLVKEELDRMGADQWGDNTYTAILQLAHEGDARFVEKEYESASAAYQAATIRAQELAASSSDVLERLVAEGATALTENDAQRAGAKFTTALRIDPANRSAQLGLQRSETMQKVEALMESGVRHEKENNLALALADYQEALRMDPSSVEARDATTRVKDRIAGEQFQKFMTLGFSALHAGQLQQAREAFQKAKSFQPHSPEVRDAMAQVDQAIRLARISDLKAKAAAAEEAETWEKALAVYEEVLAMDPAIQFAVRGKERSQERIQVTRRMRFYLDKPDLLESESHLNDAVKLVEEASALIPGGPRLSADINELDRLVQAAKTPVKVTLLSDNLTDVSVYRVGRFGKFHSLTLDLRPGTYTAVGSRIGYKDVRREIAITAGVKPSPITIQCEEKI